MGAKRQIPPTKNTSGAGFSFEDYVVANFLVDLLLERSFGIEDSVDERLIEIQVQREPDQWLLDDLLLKYQTPNGDRLVPAELKALPLLSDSTKRDRVFSDAWGDALAADRIPRPLMLGHDFLGIFTSRNRPEDINSVSEIIRKAREQDDYFFDRVIAPGHVQNGAEWLIRLNCPEELSKDHDVTDTMRRKFIASLALREFDFDLKDSDSKRNAIEMCRIATIAESRSDGLNLWLVLLTIAQNLRRDAGQINRPRLISKLPGSLRLKQVPRLAESWRQLLSECERDREQQRCSIGRHISFRREDIVDLAIEQLASGSLALLGPSGCGKSAVASILAQRLAGERTVIWMTPRRALGIASRGGRINDGSTNTLSDLVANASSACGSIIIDGIDQIAGQHQWRDMSQILRDVCDKSPGWNAIVTAQDEQWHRVRGLLSDGGVDLSDWTTLSVWWLGPTDAAQVVASYPQLSQLISNIRLQGIIQRPRILDLLVRSIDDGAELPNDWVGESQLIDWYWETRVLQLHDHVVSSGLKELARRQADDFELDTSFDDLASSTADAERIIAGGFLREQNERFAFEHDSLGDWARLRWLISQGDNLISTIKQRYNNPRWHRALRLLACRKLELTASINDWVSLYDACEEIRDFALDGLLFAAGSKSLLEKGVSLLFDNGGELLRKLLRRSLVVCSVPNERLIERVRQKKRSPTPFLRVFSRDPKPFVLVWHGLFRFLLDHCDQVYDAAAIEAARVTKMWLEMTPQGWPARSEASRIAYNHAERVHEDRLAHRSSRDWGNEGVIVYQSALTAFPEDQERGRNLFLRACSRSLPPAVEFREVDADLPGDRLGESVFSSDTEIIQPEPWPEGPIFHVDTAFREACLEDDAIELVFEYAPDLGREILLALLIDVRRPEPPDKYNDAFLLSGERFCGLIHPGPGFTMPHAQTGPYWAFLVYSPKQAIDFVLTLVNFASELSQVGSKSPVNAAPAMMECPFGGKQQLKGDENVLYWNRGHIGACERAVAPLVALEAWLVAHLDQGSSVDAHLEQIVDGARSTAFLGLLADVGRKHPDLFEGPLRPLLTSPILLIWDETLQNGPKPFRIGGPDHTISEDFFEKQKDWICAEYRSHRLVEHSERRLAPSDLHWDELRPYVDADILSTNVSDRFAAIRKLASHRLASWMYNAGASFRNIEPDNGEEATVDRPQQPISEVDEAVATIQVVQNLLSSSSTVEIESVHELVELGPRDVPQTDDPSTATLRRMAELAKATFLITRHSDELRKLNAYDRYLQYAIDGTCDLDFFEVIIQAGTSDYYSYPYWLAPVAFEAWKKNLTDSRMLRWVAHLACFSLGDAKSQIVALSFKNRKALGDWQLRLIHLMLKWSAAWWETTSYQSELQPHPSFDLDEWWAQTCNNFVAGHLSAEIPSLEDLYLRERLLFIADWRYGDHEEDETYYKAPPVDSHSVLAAILRGTPIAETAESPEERSEIVRILRLVIDCHLLYLEEYDLEGNLLSSGTDDYPALSFDGIIIDRIVEELNAISDPNEIVDVWAPVLGLGVTAPRYVEYLISKWLWACLASDEVPSDFEPKWRSMLEFCSNHPNWVNSEADSEEANLWAHLIGIDSSAFRFWRPAHKGIADRAADLIESRLELIIKDAKTAGPALCWMSRGVGGRYRMLALTWTSEVIHELVNLNAPEGQLTLSVAEFLCQIWQDHQSSIATSSTSADAFRQALRATASSGCELAVDLEQRIGDGIN